MEMDTTVFDNDMDGIEDESSKRLLASCSMSDNGDPEIIPRVGDQYQVEIPPLLGDCWSLQVVKQPIDSNVVTNVPNPFPMGLPIPLFWTKTQVESISEESHIGSSHGCAQYKVESLYPMLGETKMDVKLLVPEEPNAKPIQVDGTCPLPGSTSDVWNRIELDSFLLGLYIFGKNLILVQKFVESKAMGEILSFYYGKFYRSDGYRRWSDCRKLRRRRCIHGQKLFTGWRQQELLSRLYPRISKECRNMLLEVSKAFGEGKVSFEEYVFTIKNTVGIGMLIEAMGIDKGKLDLSGNATDLVKANHVVHFRPEIPVGKACSSLTSAEIIKFLTGDFRLSKARSSDLFWEAVWPRLLARGWHSEQPKGYGLKNSLVFLVPGVKKFSRRRLVKGAHYFDSVTDVLNKVASEPGLIELEIEVPKGSIDNLENKLDPIIKQDPDFDSTKDKRNCYLKPRKSGCSRDLMKFTIIDTSLVRGDGRCKVRELRSLPFEASSLSIPDSVSSDSEEDTSDDSEETSTTNFTEVIANGEEFVYISDCVNSNSNMVITNNISEENHESQKARPIDPKHPVPVIKRRSLSDCINGESSCSVENTSVDRMLIEDNSHCRSNSPDACEDICLHGEGSPSKTPSHTLIDLNVPQVSIGFETDGHFISETVQNNGNSCSHISLLQTEMMVKPESLDSKLLDKGDEVHNRRQSTRNRPLTTKALEALESGFFNPKRKRKPAEAALKNSRKVRARPHVSALFRNGASSSNMEEM